MNKRNRLVSALPAIRPNLVVDIKTGEIVDNWVEPVKNLLTFVRDEVKQLTHSPLDTTHLVSEWNGVPKANVHAERTGVKLQTPLPKVVLAKSRVERLVRDKLFTELASWVRNSNPLKEYPSFWPKISLGAIDRQMATLSLNDNILSLVWKVWDRELLFEFELPEYLFTIRRITKWCLPTVQISKKTGNIIFLFSFEETPTPKKTSRSKAGVDLGRVEPFTLAILNETGKRVAHYVSSGRLRELSQKRSRLIKEKKQTQSKLEQYKNLNYNPTKQAVLQTQKTRLSSKIRTIANEIAHLTGHEITEKVRAHAVHEVKVEDLRFVQGATYGGRWNHSIIQQSISHSLAREGVSTRKVNPKNTSQECHKCGTKIVHSPKNRAIHCVSCKESFDRDYNAAVNIANRIPFYPESKRALGDSPTLLKEAVQPAKSVVRNKPLTKLTT